MSERLRRVLPKSKLGWVHVVSAAVAWLVILAMIGFVLAPTMGDASAIGGHDWDQMESHRYLVKKTIARYHQFPFWDPYSCGGHTTWGGFESGTIVVSPWLPFYLATSLARAMRVEVWGSALISAIGTWLFAGRFTRSPVTRALMVVAFVVNGRWALQITAGHTWHLIYGWMPWVLYFFDRAVGADPARGPPRRRDAILAGVFLAWMVYAGGIYPLPQTAFILLLYGLFLAVTQRSLRPIGAGLVAGLVAFGLSAPKLFPVIEVLLRFPRYLESTETMDLTAFVQILTSHDQDLNSRPANVSAYGWHEWGMYVGWAVVIFATVACMFGRGVRESPLKWAALVALALAFGAFDPHAPWPLLRHVPVFKSQHVPSRWMYPALLLLLAVGASLTERILRRTGAARGWIEVALIPCVAWVAYDIAKVSRQPTVHMFATQMPAIPDSLGPFRTEVHLPPELQYAADYAPPSLPAELANIGTIDCGTFPGLNVYVRDQTGRASGLGARGRGDPAYKGEAYIPDGVGQATIASFSPNKIVVEVAGAQAGEHVVLNQNWDAGWSADGESTMNWSDAVAAQLHGADARVTFRYRPRFWYAGLATLVATLAAIGLAWARTRRTSVTTAASSPRA